MSRLVLRSSVVSAGGGGEAITGLDWDGSAPGRRQILFTGAALPSPHPLTILSKEYQRQNSARSDGTSYYTSFFWGNNGAFQYDGSEYQRAFYGAHPYPSRAPGQWEISRDALDYRGLGLTANDGTEAPTVTFNRWYRRAFIAQNTGGNNYRYEFYTDLTDITTAKLIRVNTSGWNTPPSPCLCIAQAPDNGSGLSWGGYKGWEEQNFIWRGFCAYQAVLSAADAQTLSSVDTDADCAALESGLGLTPFYRNMNPTVTDISDKSGAGHHPAWSGASRPTLWEG